MAQTPPVTASDYYEFFPPSEHRVGDIWSDLPTFGMLAIKHAPGVVITPACDLQNCKADTITYLSIVSIRQAFVLRGFLPEVIRAINGQAQVLGVDGLDDGDAPFIPLDTTQLDEFVSRIKSTEQGRNLGEREKAAAERAIAGVSVLRSGYGLSAKAATGADLRILFGSSNFDTVVGRLVTNSHRADTHFLPSDGQRTEWSAIPEPSLALFRHVYSVPIEILDCAQDLSRSEWGREISRMSYCIGGVAAFGERRPMKRQTLRPRFAADLLTRYVAMHVRLGAPDFTDASIRAYVSDVQGASE